MNTILEHHYLKVGGTPAKGGMWLYLIHFLAASLSFDADWPRWLQGSDCGPSRASRRDRKNSTPHSFSSFASMATTITALRAQDGFKSSTHVSNRRAHKQWSGSNFMISVVIWEGIYRLKLHICPQVKGRATPKKRGGNGVLACMS